MKKEFTQFILENNRDGSRKAPSYIRAIDLLGGIFAKHPHLQKRYGDVWSISDVELIDELYQFVLEQQKAYHKATGIFVDETPVSYWRDRFCSAALRSYKEFLIIAPYEDSLWNIYNTKYAKPVEVSRKMQNVEVSGIKRLVETNVDFSTKEGKETLRAVKARVNQGFFRKMVLQSYNGQCCITGLNVPEVLRASHIVAWAEDERNRMNPSNGLCLSATYDAAFDRHLITFDDDYRMILSPNLKDYTTNKAFEEHFVKFEGAQMALPTCFLPDKTLLEKHRKKAFSK